MLKFGLEDTHDSAFAEAVLIVSPGPLLDFADANIVEVTGIY